MQRIDDRGDAVVQTRLPQITEPRAQPVGLALGKAEPRHQPIKRVVLAMAVEHTGQGILDKRSEAQDPARVAASRKRQREIIDGAEIGRACCREQVCQEVSSSVVGLSLKKKTQEVYYRN